MDIDCFTPSIIIVGATLLSVLLRIETTSKMGQNLFTEFI